MSPARHLPLSRLDALGPSNPVTTLGRTGLRLNTLALGVGPHDSPMDDGDFLDAITTFREADGATFDISGDDDGYSTTRFSGYLGTVLRRDEVVLIGRSGRQSGAQALGGRRGDSSRRGLMTHLDTTLTQLGTEHLDVWLIDGLDGVTPSHEVAATMHWAIESGRASYVGLARVDAWQAVDIAHHLREHGHRLAAHSLSFSLLERQAEGAAHAAATALGYGIIGARPLAAGALTGKYRHLTPPDSRLASGDAHTVKRYLDARHRPIIESLATAADGLGVNPAELALAWALQSGVTDVVTLGVRTAQQLTVCLRALELNLPAQIVTVLDEVSAPG